MNERTTVLDEAFDVANEEGTPPISLLPPGKYAAEIEEAYVAATKNGTGQAVGLKWRIVDGEYENRVLFQSVLIQHTSADAQKFGRQQFKDICYACGITDLVTDLEVLKFKKCHLTVKIERDKTGEYPDKNKVSRVVPYAASWNGSKPVAAILKEASTTDKPQPNDEIPF